MKALSLMPKVELSCVVSSKKERKTKRQYDVRPNVRVRIRWMLKLEELDE